MEEEGKIVFYASLPPTSDAVKIKGEGHGKLFLEFSASEKNKVLPLTDLGGQLLKVTIELE